MLSVLSNTFSNACRPSKLIQFVDETINGSKLVVKMEYSRQFFWNPMSSFSEKRALTLSCKTPFKQFEITFPPRESIKMRNLWRYLNCYEMSTSGPCVVACRGSVFNLWTFIDHCLLRVANTGFTNRETCSLLNATTRQCLIAYHLWYSIEKKKNFFFFFFFFFFK